MCIINIKVETGCLTDVSRSLLSFLGTMLSVIALGMLSQPSSSFYQSTKAYKLKTKHQHHSSPISLSSRYREKVSANGH
jgi:hypothetical protein